MRKSSFASIILFLLSVQIATAQVVISEIMYDLEGADTDREWIEVQNTGASSVDVGSLFLNEANTNHKLTVARGDANIPAGGFAVIASNATKFISENSAYGGVVFDSSFSLSNEGETLGVTQKNVGGTYDALDSVTYSKAFGANGDGNSLQKSSSGFVASAPTLGSGFSGVASQSATVSSNTSTTGTQASTASTSTVSTTDQITGGGFPVEPQLFANAGVDRNVTVGSSVVFSGTAVGLKKEPLLNARYHWNFGDGEIKEGVNVSHVYRAEGKYVVILTATSGYFSAIDKLEVVATTPSVSIGEIKSGDSGFITLKNTSANLIDISGFQIHDADNYFVIPQDTVLAGNASVKFFNGTTKLKPTDSSVFLTYATGEKIVLNNSTGTFVQTSVAQNNSVVQKVASSKSSGFLASAKNPEQTPPQSKSNNENINKYYAGVAGSTENVPASRLWWYGALALVIIAGGAGVILLRRIGREQEENKEPKDEADEYELV